MKSKAWMTVTSSTKQWPQQKFHSLATLVAVRPAFNHNHLFMEEKRSLVTTANSTTPYPLHPLYTSRSSVSCRSLNELSTDDHLKPLPLLDFFSKSNAKPTKSYTFTHGATGYPKKERYLTPDFKQSHSHYRSVQVGEDAYFSRSDALGVADGVGGWAGVSAANPALYSRKLMHHAYMEMERFDNVDDPSFYHYDKADPLDILQKSYEESMEEVKKEGIIGSCTACLAILRYNELRIANLGDCGISIIRHNDYIFRSEEQQHSFNFPYQLGTSSPDQPKDAQCFTVSVEKGDIIIMGSDGLYDNLFDKDILSIVQSYVSNSTLPGNNSRPPRVLSIEPQKLSNILAEKAHSASLSKDVSCPFQVKALNEGIFYQGGKADDITVLVAIVNDSEDSPDRRL
ncbi:phosphatase 2C-like domain-containing protein [Pilobolus umbonatus]|nr:phosphatase 2C-like domain-containing protein [Pilobolus umbonatus]